MNRFELSHGLRIGHKEIDADHEDLINQLNGCIELTKSGKPVSAFADGVAALCDSLAQHIVREESIMQALGFPEIEREQQEHERAISEFRRLIPTLINLDLLRRLTWIFG